MKKLLSITVLLLIGFTVFIIMPSAAPAESTLAWKTFKLAGYYNGSGEEKGISDKILDYYIRHLPEYKHNIQELPIVRLFKTMAKVTEGGYLGPVKTKLSPEQLKNVLASTINLINPPPGIAVRKNDLNTHFSRGKNVSVQHLLNEKKLICCWIRGATFHPRLREALEDYVSKNETHPNVYFLSQIKENIIKMLEFGRIDYYPVHAIPFQYDCARQKGCSDNLMFIPVDEAQEDVITYTFAAKTETGREVINKINKIHNSEAYKKFLRELISERYPPDLVDIYVKKNMELVGKEMR